MLLNVKWGEAGDWEVGLASTTVVQGAGRKVWPEGNREGKSQGRDIYKNTTCLLS